MGRRAFLVGVQRGGWWGSMTGRCGWTGEGSRPGCACTGRGEFGCVEATDAYDRSYSRIFLWAGMRCTGGALYTMVRASASGVCVSAANRHTSRSSSHLGHLGSVAGCDPLQAAQRGGLLHPWDGCPSLQRAQRTDRAVQARSPCPYRWHLLHRRGIGTCSRVVYLM